MNRGRMALLGSLACAVCAASEARADVFEVTDLDAADVLEIKPFLEFETNRDGTSLEGPGVDLTFPVAPGLEASIVTGAGYLDEDGARGRWGMTDTEFAAKWAIVPIPEEGGWGIATEPAIIAPTGTHGLGDDEWRAEVPIMIGWASGPWELRGKLGYERGLETGEDEVFIGGLVKYSVDDALSVGVEVAGGAERLGFGSYEPSVNVGVNWEFAPEIELQARLGRSLHNEDHLPTTAGKIAIEFAF